MKTRKILALTLAMVLCLGLFAVPAGAYDMGKAGERHLISVGGEHAAAIDANGSLWMRGGNWYG